MLTIHVYYSYKYEPDIWRSNSSRASIIKSELNHFNSNKIEFIDESLTEQLFSQDETHIKNEILNGLSSTNVIVILINETTISRGEFFAMMFEQHPRLTKIGSQTAGADGDVVTIYLPGGITTNMTGIGIYYPDGAETQRVGIIPDIEIKPTIEGVKLNKDELLEKAIELINNEK